MSEGFGEEKPQPKQKAQPLDKTRALTRSQLNSRAGAKANALRLVDELEKVLNKFNDTRNLPLLQRLKARMKASYGGERQNPVEEGCDED